MTPCAHRSMAVSAMHFRKPAEAWARRHATLQATSIEFARPTTDERVHRCYSLATPTTRLRPSRAALEETDSPRDVAGDRHDRGGGGMAVGAGGVGENVDPILAAA